MKFDDLLTHRDQLVQAAKLANLAYAYQWLRDFTGRIARAGLNGEVVLRGPEPEEGRPEPALVAQDFSRSIIEEHFLSSEIGELHAVLTSVHDAGPIVEARFRLEEIGSLYLPVLRKVLQAADVLPGDPASALGDTRLDAA